MRRIIISHLIWIYTVCIDICTGLQVERVKMKIEVMRLIFVSSIAMTLLGTWKLVALLFITKTRLFKYMYIEYFTAKNWKFSDKKILIIFKFLLKTIDCGYPLEPPRRGGSNEYPQSMVLSRNKRNNVYPCKPQFYYIGLRGSKLYNRVFVMAWSVACVLSVMVCLLFLLMSLVYSFIIYKVMKYTELLMK